MVTLLPIALIIGGYWYVTGGQVISTDDAYVEVDKVGISTDVAGIVQAVDVTENQHVAAAVDCGHPRARHHVGPIGLRPGDQPAIEGDAVHDEGVNGGAAHVDRHPAGGMKYRRADGV